jgi:hypothetical protein
MREEKASVVANLQYGGDYRSSLEEAARTKQCIFCKEEFRASALCAAGNWMVKRNDYPSKDRSGNPAQHQFLFFRADHGDDLVPLLAEDMADIATLLAWCKEKFSVSGGCFFFRDGDPSWSGRTVRHPHAHYYVPNFVSDPDALDGKRVVPIDIPVG